MSDQDLSESANIISAPWDVRMDLSDMGDTFYFYGNPQPFDPSEFNEASRMRQYMEKVGRYMDLIKSEWDEAHG